MSVAFVCSTVQLSCSKTPSYRRICDPVGRLSNLTTWGTYGKLDGRSIVFSQPLKTCGRFRLRPSFVMTARSKPRTSALLPPAVSSLLFVAANHVLTSVFKRYRISFPPALSGMLILFSILSLARFIFRRRSSAITAWSSRYLMPGTTQLSRWLAVFFAPNLVMLPLAPALAASDVAKVGFVTIAGFLCSLVSTALIVMVLRINFREADQDGAVAASKGPGDKSPAAAWPQSGVVLGLLLMTTLSFLGGIVWSGQRSIKLVFDVLLTVTCFSIGMRLPKRVKVMMHPLVFCVLGTIGGMWLFGVMTGVSFRVALGSYLTRSFVHHWGGGDILAWLTGPAVISFGCQMDNRRKLMRQRAGEIFGSTVLASLIGLFGTAATVRWMRLGQKARLFMLPRMVTAPLAVSIADMLGAHVGLAATVVAVTGLLGANFGPIILSALRFKDPVARGLAVGSASHGLGTAGISEEENAFPFAAIAMALVGVVSTLVVAIPALRGALIVLALGKTGGPVLAVISR